MLPIEPVQTTVYVDECGHTGEDLSDPDTPVFVVASHDVHEGEARSWKERFFSRVVAGELKHSQLQRRAGHHGALVEFVREALSGRRVRAALAHKRFSLVAKLVDWLVEPALHAGGLDLYEGGANVALSNVVYFSLAARGDASLDRVIRAFQRAARTRDPKLMYECNEVLRSNAVQAALGEVGSFFSVSMAQLGERWIERMPPRSLALSTTLALQVCYAWRRRGLASFEIVHDRSTALARERDVWELILSKQAPPAMVGHADFQVEFPVGVEEVRFEDSANLASLQLADLLAGAIARWAGWMSRGSPAGDTYAAALHEVMTAHLEDTVDLALWPVPIVEKRAQPPSEVANPLEYLTTLLAGPELHR